MTGYSGAGVKNSANRISSGCNAGVLHVCLFRSPARLPALHPGTLILYRSLFLGRQGGPPHGAAYEWFDLSHRFDRRDPLHPLALRPAVAPGREVVP